jgi:3-phosphoshikimate 1-carboxyvinyltransferase
VNSYDDHRMAMAFAVLGLGTEGIVIEGAESVAKTFPDFFETLDLLRS